jgi:hypothetical protein
MGFGFFVGMGVLDERGETVDALCRQLGLRGEEGIYQAATAACTSCARVRPHILMGIVFMG